MQIDQLPSYVLTIAATNHAELLDRAVWRRFQLRIAFPAPQQKEISSYLQKLIESWPDKPTLSTNTLAGRLGAMSYAEARDFCLNVRRRQILGLGEVDIDSAINTELTLWVARVKPEVTNADRSRQAASSTKHQRVSTTSTRPSKKSPQT
jgi:AAA+ superfamily predicted ATPase